jgi:hypothetical protein
LQQHPICWTVVYLDGFIGPEHAQFEIILQAMTTMMMMVIPLLVLLPSLSHSMALRSESIDWVRQKS